MERNSAQLFAAPYPTVLQTSGPLRPWRQFLVDHVGLYRYRHRQAGLREGRIDARRRLDEYGFVGAAAGVYRPTPEGLPHSHPYRRIMHAYDFSGPSVEAFVRLLAWGREAGVPVVVVNMPFRPALLQISPRGREDYDRYMRAIAALRQEFGFGWLDYESGLTLADADFRDVDHLNAAGVTKVSRQIGHDLGVVVAEAAR
jgi:hypothetical protein